MSKKYEQEFLQLKEMLNELAKDQNYKIRYFTGDLGEKVKVIDPLRKVAVRALTVENAKGSKIVVIRSGKHILAMKDGVYWDITSSFLFFKAKKYLGLKESVRRKLIKDEPMMAGTEMLLRIMTGTGIAINEIIDIFTVLNEEKEPFKIVEL